MANCPLTSVPLLFSLLLVSNLVTVLGKLECENLPQLCKTHRTRRVIADPVKKAMDAEYLRSLLPKPTSTDAMAPGASPIPENGDGQIPGSWIPTGPDYRGYGGPAPGNVVATTGGKELPEAPAASPVSGSDNVPPPLEQAPSSTPTVAQGPSSTPTVAQGPSSSKRPFFFITPTPSPTATQSGTQSGTQSEVGQPTQSAPAPAVPSLDQGSELNVSWQQELTNRHHLNEEDQYLYETYFH